MSSHRIRLGSALVCLAMLYGCGSSGPPVHVVKGRIVYKGKGNVADLANGTVTFQSTSNANVKSVGSIEDDGSFLLGTFHEGKELSGVLAGVYKARVQPPRDDSDEDNPNPRLPIHRKYLDFDKSGLTFTVPVSGEIVIEVTRP